MKLPLLPVSALFARLNNHHTGDRNSFVMALDILHFSFSFHLKN
jgi:hypothetical protein